MGSIPPELSLDFRPAFVPKTIGDFLKEVSAIADTGHRLSKLDDFVRRLQEEMKKIDAFKRELPLCMLLMKDAIMILKVESERCTAAPITTRPVLEEFIPLKKDREEDEKPEEKEIDSKDKKNWMSSVQLWNTGHNPSVVHSSDPKQDLKLETTGNQAQTLSATQDILQACKERNGARAVTQFNMYSPFTAVATGVALRKEEKIKLPVQGLSLLTSGLKNPREKLFSTDTRPSCRRLISSPAHNVQSHVRSGAHPPPPPLQQSSRKQRRCWSPDLHRRFVNALQQLGGSQAATPKQIRELMQVDGLTNDEVKSHLQKYRLHTRRISSSSSSHADQPITVLGGLWVSSDQYGDSSKATSSQSGSPQGPLQLGGCAGANSTTGGNSMEDDEDAKSESYSWKSHSNRTGKVNV